MRKLFTILFISFLSITTKAQELKTVFLNKDISTHFLSRIYIDKIDISCKNVVGTLQNKKIFAIRPKDDSKMDLGIVSVIGEDYFIQYRLKYTYDIDKADKQIRLDNNSQNYFLHPDFEMTNADMYAYSKKIEKLLPAYYNTSSKANKIQIRLNNIIVKDRHIFIDFSIENYSNLLYDVDDIKFFIDDKKIKKNTNIQRQLIKKVFSYNKDKSFKKHYRNIVCFNKMTFPDNKVFVIELTEKQVTGRVAKLTITYLDVLNADTL